MSYPLDTLCHTVGTVDTLKMATISNVSGLKFLKRAIGYDLWHLIGHLYPMNWLERLPVQ